MANNSIFSILYIFNSAKRLVLDLRHIFTPLNRIGGVEGGTIKPRSQVGELTAP